MPCFFEKIIPTLEIKLIIHQNMLVLELILKIFHMVDGTIGYIILTILRRYIIKETTK